MLKLTFEELQYLIKHGNKKLSGIECKSPRSLGVALTSFEFSDCTLTGNLFNGSHLENCTFSHCNELPRFDFTLFEETVDFTGSNLVNCSFRHAAFWNAELVVDRAKPPYHSSRFWAELLKRRATTLEQKQVVALIYSAEYLGWCWHDFLEMNHPLQDWVVQTLRSYNLDFSDCPEKAKILVG